MSVSVEISNPANSSDVLLAANNIIGLIARTADADKSKQNAIIYFFDGNHMTSF